MTTVVRNAWKFPLIAFWGVWLVVFLFLDSVGHGDVFGQEQSSVLGITEPTRDVTLGLTLPGTISKIFFKEGSQVKKGKVILELDNRVEELELMRRKVIWEGKAELESANAKVTTLGNQLESTRALFDSTKSVSREELEQKELDYKLAVAEKEGLEMEEEKQRIEYVMALENLRKRKLFSPIRGTIIKIFLDEGECYEPEQPLVRVVDTSRCILVCNMEEALGRSLKKGQAVEMKVRTGSGFVYKQGVMAFVSPVVDPASGLLKVKAEFDNKDGEVRPGVAGYLLLNGPEGGDAKGADHVKREGLGRVGERADRGAEERQPSQ